MRRFLQLLEEALLNESADFEDALERCIKTNGTDKEAMDAMDQFTQDDGFMNAFDQAVEKIQHKYPDVDFKKFKVQLQKKLEDDLVDNEADEADEKGGKPTKCRKCKKDFTSKSGQRFCRGCRSKDFVKNALTTPLRQLMARGFNNKNTTYSTGGE